MATTNRSWVSLLLIGVLVFIGVLIVYLSLRAHPASGPSCDYNDSAKSYVKQVPNCTINFLCTVGHVPFSDACGCGCEVAPTVQNDSNVSVNESNGLARHLCTPEQQAADVCYEIYQPVCGWSGNASKPYSNDCFACKDNVSYWTGGACQS